MAAPLGHGRVSQRPLRHDRFSHRDVFRLAMVVLRGRIRALTSTGRLFPLPLAIRLCLRAEYFAGRFCPSRLTPARGGSSTSWVR